MAYFSNFKDIAYYLGGQYQCNILTTLWPKYYVYYLPQSTETKKYLRIEELDGGIFGTSIGAKYRPIGSIDLIINENNQTAEIAWWMVNDKLHYNWTPNLYSPTLSESDAKVMNKLLLSYAKHMAKEFGCNKIKRDVHQSLNEYNHHLKYNGFILTDEKADDHSVWLKTYKYL